MAFDFGFRILLNDEIVRVLNRQGQLVGVYHNDQPEYNLILKHYGYNDLLLPTNENRNYYEYDD